MTPQEKEELNKFLDKNIASQRIKPSNSPYAAPCFFVPKKDGSLRLCQDYCKLNDVSIKDKTPLPLISEVIDQLKDAKYFNKLDIIWGYNNVRIREGDEWKAAFLTNQGLFEPTVMFFGMSNSPATFSRMITTIFREMLQEGSCYDLNEFNSGCNERQRLEGEKGIINKLVKRKEYRSITTLLIRLGLPKVTINGVGLSNYDRGV
jgi:hypothetical protein